MTDLVVLGGGAHLGPLLDLISYRRDLRPVGVLDPGLARGTQVLGFPVIGGDEMLERLKADGVTLAALGLGGDFKPGSGLRRRVAQRARALGFSFPALIHPAACVAGSARIGTGGQVFASAVVAAGAVLEEDCCLNHNATIDHDCRIGPGLFTGTATVLAGSIAVEADVQIGAGAIVLPRLKIGQGAVVGAGSVVTRDVAANHVVYGNPARVCDQLGRKGEDG